MRRISVRVCVGGTVSSSSEGKQAACNIKCLVGKFYLIFKLLDRRRQDRRFWTEW